MKQVYHPNAVTNVHVRRQIKESSLTNFELAQTFHTSPATISKWKNRETEVTSIRFRNRKREKSKSLKNMSRAIFIWM